MRTHKSIWKSGGIQISALVIFVFVVQLIVWLTKVSPPQGQLVFWGIVFSLVPALLWMSFFYQRDRLEPEPKHYVFGVFILGAFLTYSIGIPLVKHVFKVNEWLYLTPWGYILGSILVVGVIHQAIAYATVRYTVYPTSEFDERIDGIIYGTAAGLGIATMLNISYVIELGGALLVIAAIYCVINALAYASFGGIMGYFISTAKFGKGAGQGQLIWGVAIAAVLNGLFFWLQRLLVFQSTRYEPWYGLITGIVVVVVIYGILEALMRSSVALEESEDKSSAGHGGE
jgi:RsiW-degrading membrane proteinase PrsW (M82 family)